MNLDDLDTLLDKILERYSRSFKSKLFLAESSEIDDLMQVFGLTQADKAQNKQYWGRELGMCWQLLVAELCRQTHSDFAESIKDGADELYDLRIGKEVIDTKYRIGSGDSGTLKKFKQYAIKLREQGDDPVMLILRNDNLPAAITALKTGGWRVIVGANSYAYIKDKTGFDLEAWFKVRKNYFRVKEQASIESI